MSTSRTGMGIGIEALRRAKDILGSERAVADVAGVTQSAVHQILARNSKVPPEWCRPIEAATRQAGQTVTRQDLRPDLFSEKETVSSRAPNRSRHKSRTGCARCEGIRALLMSVGED